MTDIFEGAKFGDKFITREGKIAILISCYPNLDIATLGIKCESTDGFTIHELSYQLDGKHDAFLQKYDIVSKYQEPIDEDKLDELAINECAELLKNDILYYEAGDECVECVVLSNAEECFKAGYHKAMEE